MEIKVQRDELVHLDHRDHLENQARFLDSLEALEEKDDLFLTKWKTMSLKSRSAF